MKKVIKIKRANCPQSLNKAYNAFRKNDYSNNNVKETLLIMQHRKCCYCEVELDKSGPLTKEVEHYIPKSADDFKDASGNTQWHLANSWTNLLFSCRNCNGKKSNQHPFDQCTGERRLIDPTCEDIDPEEHIDFILDEDFMMHNVRGKTPLGQTTSEMLQFAIRSDLFGGFLKVSLKIEGYIGELIIALINGNNVKCNAMKKDLRRMMSAHCEFAAFRRAFISKKIKRLNEEIIPKLEAEYNNAFDRITIDIPQGAEVVE